MTTRRVVLLVRGAFGLGLMLLLTGSLAVAQQAPATARLSDITVATQPDAVTVFVKTSAPAKYQAELIDSPTRLVIDFEDTDYAWRKTPLNVAASPLKQIRGSQYKKGVARVVVQLDRKVGYAIREDDGGLAIVIPTSPQAKAPADTPSSTTATGSTDNRADATDPKAQVKSPVARPAPQVRVAQAPPRAATPAPAPAAPAEPAAPAAAEAAERGPHKKETIRLAYADPEDLAKTLSGILGIPEGGSLPVAPPSIVPIPAPPFSSVFGPGAAPVPVAAPTPSADVLAKGITIRAHKPTNSIFIRHYANDLERIKKLIRESLDIPLPQVKIEARPNEINRTDLFEIGVQWGGSGAKRDGSHVLVGQGFAPFSREGGQQITRAVDIGQRAGGVETLTGFGGAATAPSSQITSPITNPLSPLGLAQLLPVSSLTGLPLGGNAVNLLPSNLPTGGISFGLIGTNFNLNLALQALEESSKTRSLSKPEIVTVENAKASIALGSEIPYATVSSAGTQVQFKEATLRLEVTPTVVFEPNNINRIKLLVVVEDNSKGADVNAGAGGLIPSINKRRADTLVLIKEGDTLVIGGITQRTDVESVRKVPLFGDIPVIGRLFKTKQIATNPNRELVIFVTPSVVRRDTPRASLQTGAAQR